MMGPDSCGRLWRGADRQGPHHGWLTAVPDIMAGRLPAPPIAKALGFWMSEVELGRVVFGYEPVFEHYNPLGSVHGGIAATLLDW